MRKTLNNVYEEIKEKYGTSCYRTSTPEMLR